MEGNPTRFAEFWQALRQSLGGHTEWSRRVTTSRPRGGGEYVVMLHILSLSPPSSSQLDGNGAVGGSLVGGRLAVLGGESGAAGGEGHQGLWALDVNAKTLGDFEEEVLEYKEVSDFAQELAQALLEQDTPPGSQGGGSQPKPKGSQQQQQGPPTVRVVPPPAHGGPLKVEVDFRLQEGSGTFTLRPVQTPLAPQVLPTLLPFFHLDRRGFGRHPLPLPPPEEEEEEGAGKKGGTPTTKAKGQKKRPRKGGIF